MIQPLHNRVVGEHLRDHFSSSPTAALDWSHYWVDRRLVGLNRALEEKSGQFCFGEQLTIADIFLFPQVEKARGFNIELSKFPAVMKVMENLKKLPAFQNSYAPQ